MLGPVLAVAASLALSYLWNEDFWWYLSSGNYLLEHGRFPAADPFLYSTQAGSGWVYHSWLWTVLVAALHQWLGLGGVVVLHGLCALALCTLVYTAGRVDRLGLVNALAVALLLATTGQRLCGKAEVATWLLLAIFYRLLDPGAPFTWRRGAVLGALQLLWANLHGGFPLGVFVALCYAIGPRLEPLVSKPSRAAGSRASRAMGPPLWFPALLLVIAVADPWMHRDMYLERLKSFAFVTESASVHPVGESGNVLLEWQSPLRAARTNPRPLWLFGLATLAGLASFVAARRRSTARFLFFAGMVVLGATAVRFLPGVALAAALAIIGNLEGGEWRRRANRPTSKRRTPTLSAAPKAKWVYPAACAGIAVVLLAAAVALRMARSGFEAGQPAGFFTIRPAIAAAQAADFVLERELPGPIFNDYQSGAYLTHRLYPRHRLFIDSRVLDPEVVVRVTKMVGSPDLWKQAESEYGFRTVILGNYSKTVRSPLGAALLRDASWRLAYLDPFAVVFVKRDSGAEPPGARLNLEPSGKPPFVASTRQPAPLAALQRIFLDDFPANYLVEYLAILGQFGQTAKVVELATAALRSEPGNPLIHRQRCAGHLSLRAIPAALEDCAIAHRLRPDDPQIVALYVTVLMEAGRRPQALAILERARRTQSDPMLDRLWRSLQARP